MLSVLFFCFLLVLCFRTFVVVAVWSELVVLVLVLVLADDDALAAFRVVTMGGNQENLTDVAVHSTSWRSRGIRLSTVSSSSSSGPDGDHSPLSAASSPDDARLAASSSPGSGSLSSSALVRSLPPPPSLLSLPPLFELEKLPAAVASCVTLSGPSLFMKSKATTFFCLFVCISQLFQEHTNMHLTIE